MPTLENWLLPGFKERITDIANQAKKLAPRSRLPIEGALVHEVAQKCYAEFSSHLELIEDLQDRLAQYEGRTPAKSIVHRSFIPITLKAAQSNGVRSITGMATTATPDRMGDIVEPMGARIKLPVPLLLQHDHGQPVGIVKSAKRTSSGIPFEAVISEVKEPGRLKDRTDEAWHCVQHGLIGFVSIGFRAPKSEPIKNGGTRFIDWEMLELSLVVIPAQPEAVIDTPITKNLADAYAGIWQWGSTHERGTLITDHGSLWLSLEDTSKRPGEGPDWRLVSKKGKPGNWR